MAATDAPMTQHGRQQPQVAVVQEFPVGCSVKLVTLLGEEVQGVVFTYDKGSNVVVLESLPGGQASQRQTPGDDGAGERGARQYRMLRANYIREVVSVDRPKTGDYAGVLKAIDMQWVDRREAENIRCAARTQHARDARVEAPSFVVHEDTDALTCCLALSSRLGVHVG